MAERKTSTRRFTMGEYIQHTWYEGAREELVARGIVSDPALFADGSILDAHGRVKRTMEGEVDGRRISVCWLRERGLYKVFISTTPEEREARKARHAAEEAEYVAQQIAERKARAAQQLAADLARLGPKGVGAVYRDGMKIAVGVAFNVADDPRFAWRFPEATREEALQLIRRLVDLWENGGMRANKVALATQDQQFQRFMSKAAGGRAA